MVAILWEPRISKQQHALQWFDGYFTVKSQFNTIILQEQAAISQSWNKDLIRQNKWNPSGLAVQVL